MDPEKWEKALEVGGDEIFERDDLELSILTEKRGKLLDAVIDKVLKMKGKG